MAALLLLLAACLAAVQGDGKLENMNGLYKISNPNLEAGVEYSTDYSTKDAEYFDVYTPPIQTRYGEVFWTMMSPVPIPDAIKQRFAGKTIAIIGYETNQVKQTPDGDVAVPITWAYNHHYVAFMTGTKSTLVRADPNTYLGGQFSNLYANREFWVPQEVDDGLDAAPEGVPTSQMFSEGNGGEFRKSYHGYPKGFAQLLYSPDTFHITPMQIDTHNRDHDGADFVPGPLPRTAQSPPNASYSGILECPCTDRLVREVHTVYTALTKGTCPTAVVNETECFTAAQSMGASANASHATIAESSLPSGCIIVRSDGGEKVYLNTQQSTAQCGGGTKFSGKQLANNKTVSLNLNLDQSSGAGEAVITITGPDGVWFGIGFNAQTMSDKPYAIIINGTGGVQERKLGDHDPGSPLASSLDITSNTVSNGVRTVVMQRAMKGMTKDHFTFSPSTQSSLPFISAIGSGPSFAVHKFKGAATLALTALDGTTCVCNSGRKGSIGGIPFNKNCWDEPYGDLIQQNNPTCFVDAYAGGLRCCHHQWILLDKDQNPWPNQIDEYHLKFRFWFQEYDPVTPKHTNLLRIFWETEVWSTEYDVPKKSPETPPENAIHQITSRWKVGEMMHECNLREGHDCTGSRNNKTGINLIYAGGHCHAPSCMSMELYNADNGQLLCRHNPIYGQGTEPFDETGYLALPPCLWGTAEEGLQEPVFLSFNTNLISIKRNNNTYGHYGEMALWQMRGILV